MIKKLSSIFLVLSCSAIILTFAIGSFASDIEDYSIFENRYLAAEPELSIESLQNGSYFTDFGTYLGDRIFQRDKLLSIYTAARLNLESRKVVSNVVVTENVLLPYTSNKYPECANENEVALTADKFASLAKDIEAVGGHFFFMGVPCQSQVFKNDYPSYINNDGSCLENTEKLLFNMLGERNVDVISATDVFKEAGDPRDFYLKTDHHYRLEGAFLLYRALCERVSSLGYEIPEITENDFDYRELDNPFYGSRSRKLYDMSPLTEKLTVYELKSEIPFTRINNGVESPAAVFRLPADSTEKIDYTMYMYGDIGETIINTNRPELPNILIFGDSYTNAVECFSYLSFNEMRSLDLRQYTEKTLRDYIEEYKPDIVVDIRDSSMYLSVDGNGNF